MSKSFESYYLTHEKFSTHPCEKCGKPALLHKCAYCLFPILHPDFKSSGLQTIEYKDIFPPQDDKRFFFIDTADISKNLDHQISLTFSVRDGKYYLLDYKEKP